MAVGIVDAVEAGTADVAAAGYVARVVVAFGYVAALDYFAGVAELDNSAAALDYKGAAVASAEVVDNFAVAAMEIDNSVGSVVETDSFVVADAVVVAVAAAAAAAEAAVVVVVVAVGNVPPGATNFANFGKN